MNFTLKYFLKHFKKSIIISLRKSNKFDYSIFKAYRSIAFLNTMNKIMKRLANMTHLYVVPATNLFHLEGPSRWNRAKRSRNLPRSCAPGHEFRTISNIFNRRSAYTGPRSRSIHHRMHPATSLPHPPNHSIRNERRIYTDRPFEWNNGSKRGHIGLFR